MQDARTKNSARWTGESVLFCAPLATWMNAALQKLSPEQRKSEKLQTAHLQLATLLYECGEWEAWENQLRAAGTRPARDIEKALTYDSNAKPKNSYNTIRDYVNENGATP